MKASKYNIFYPYNENNYIAYNSRTNALALMGNEKYNEFIKFKEEINNIDEKLIEDLKIGEFIIEDSIDELKLLRYRMNKARFDTSALSLTIAITSDCNFRCEYCYEKHIIKPQSILLETEKHIYNLIENMSSHINQLSITWYGGEPLLEIDAIKRMSKKIMKITEENKIHYVSNMITNGYLLNREICQTLKKYNIENIQITLDGSEKIHNKRRPLINGEGTFKTIVNNLVDCIDILPIVSLRVNIDSLNIDSGKDISNLIKKLKLDEKVFPYLGRIVNNNNCIDENSISCLSMKEYSIEDYNYSIDNLIDSNILFRYPKPVGNVCGADRLMSYVIDPEGNIYKCWSDLGDKNKTVGNLAENFNLNAIYLNYMDFDPTLNKLCKDCNLLPVCMGGCPVRRTADYNGDCSIYKYMLEEYLNSFTNYYENK